jgi:hypothetical protein
LSDSGFTEHAQELAPGDFYVKSFNDAAFLIADVD